jgi:arylsulfatase A-like enzyme
LPNIIFFMADQLTPFMTSPYGQKVAQTPNMQRLAYEGTLFENAYCNSPLCVPSRVSMFTGRLPAQVAAFDNASEFEAHRPTIMHYLRRVGYLTVVAGKCHFIGPDQMHGFDERLTPCIFPAGFSMLPDWKLGPVYNKGTSVQSLLRMLGPSKTNNQMAFDHLAFDKSLERLRQHAAAGSKQPFFLNISLTHPHDPYMEREDLASTVFDDEETIQDAEGEGWHGEEVHGCDDLAVIAQESSPELAGLFPRIQAPEQPEASPMPGDNSFRSDNEQDIAPCRPKTAEQNPKHAILDAQPRTRLFSFEYTQLLT